MARKFSFSAGTSMLPQWVLETAAAQMSDYEKTGQSVMELNYRSREYVAILQECEILLRQLMQIPKNYKVLFLQGGGSLQLSMIPMNLMTVNKKIDMIHTGVWTKKAMDEMRKFGRIHLVASGELDGFRCLPEIRQEKFSWDADYVYLCQDNTVYGTAMHQLPDTGGVPIVADLSSCILSRCIDVSRYGMIFASAQKNMGCAGLTVVIIREDLLERSPHNLSPMLSYKVQANKNSLYNTPPTYAIYICMLVLRWLKEKNGGLIPIERQNRQKAEILYEYLDSSKIFTPYVTEKEDRSVTNITFGTGSQEMDQEFLEVAARYGLINLKGHRLVGGLRACLSNAMPLEGVHRLVTVMAAFEGSKQFIERKSFSKKSRKSSIKEKEQ